jgi:hypothetical protein
LRGTKSPAAPKRQPSLKLLRRMEQIDRLPGNRQRALLAAIDFFLQHPQIDRLEPMSDLRAYGPGTKLARILDKLPRRTQQHRV